MSTRSYPNLPQQHSFPVEIGPTLYFDITEFPSRNIQRVIKMQLGTTEYEGFEGRKTTHAITMHLESLEDVRNICMITRIV